MIIALVLTERPDLDESYDVEEGFCSASPNLADQHALCAARKISEGIHSGKKLFDVLRALFLLSVWQFGQASPLEGSISSASAIRLAVSLDLPRQASGPRWFEPGRPRIYDDSSLAF